MVTAGSCWVRNVGSGGVGVGVGSGSEAASGKWVLSYFGLIFYLFYLANLGRHFVRQVRGLFIIIKKQLSAETLRVFGWVGE